MKDQCQWLNFQWGLDVFYTRAEEAPLLDALCKKYGQFWVPNQTQLNLKEALEQ